MTEGVRYPRGKILLRCFAVPDGGGDYAAVAKIAKLLSARKLFPPENICLDFPSEKFARWEPGEKCDMQITYPDFYGLRDVTVDLPTLFLHEYGYKPPVTLAPELCWLRTAALGLGEGQLGILLSPELKASLPSPERPTYFGYAKSQETYAAFIDLVRRESSGVVCLVLPTYMGPDPSDDRLGIQRGWVADMTTLWPTCEPLCPVTGDQTLSEAISAQKQFIWEYRIHKTGLRTDLTVRFGPSVVYFKGEMQPPNIKYPTPIPDCGPALEKLIDQLMISKVNLRIFDPPPSMGLSLACWLVGVPVPQDRVLPLNQPVRMTADQMRSLRIRGNKSDNPEFPSDSHYEYESFGRDFYILIRR